MSQTLLADLLNELEQELIRLQYAQGTLEFYRRRWKWLLDFAGQQGVEVYTEAFGAAFLEDKFNLSLGDFTAELTQAQTQEIRVVRMIGDFQQHHAILRRYYKHNEILTAPFFLDVRTRFHHHCQAKDYSKVTIEHYVKKSSYFMDYLQAQGMESFEGLTASHINAYLRTLAGFSFKTVEQHVCALRAFFRFLLAEGIAEQDYAVAMPTMKDRKQNNIPSVWTEDELKQLLTAIDRGNPAGKRDYALILIACRLGLRVRDIKHLTYDSFDWSARTIHFVQSKTRQETTLPLPSDVGWAVIDYLQNGRPKVDSSCIFVRHVAPFLPFSDDDHLSQIIRKYMKDAGISRLNKRCGMHSLRHTMASILLENETPLPVISDILGHIDTNSTAAYLKVDLQRLALCPLDFEEAIDID